MFIPQSLPTVHRLFKQHSANIKMSTVARLGNTVENKINMVLGLMELIA